MQLPWYMSWSLVIAVLLGSPTIAPCSAVVYGGSTRPNYGLPQDDLSLDSPARFGNSAASGTAVDGSQGRAEALRRFASTRAMKTGTTIAGVIFEVSLRWIAQILQPLLQWCFYTGIQCRSK